jgi:hypothetical protein
VGIGILKTNASIGIPASVISVRYRSKKCRTASFYSSSGSVPASLVFLSPLPDRLDARQSSIPVVSIAVVSKAVVSIAVVSIAVGFENTNLFAKTFVKTKIFMKTKIIAKTFAKAKIFEK